MGCAFARVPWGTRPTMRWNRCGRPERRRNGALSGDGATHPAPRLRLRRSPGAGAGAHPPALEPAPPGTGAAAGDAPPPHLPDELMALVACHGGPRGRAAMMCVSRALRRYLRGTEAAPFRWPGGVPFALPTDRPALLTGCLAVEGLEIAGVPDDGFAGAPGGNHYVCAEGAGTAVRLAGCTLRGVGVRVRGGARVELAGCRVAGAPANGLCVGGAARASLHGGRISGAGGCGVELSGEGLARLRGAAVSRSGSHGVYCEGPGARCEADGLTVEGGGWGALSAYAGAAVTLRSVEAPDMPPGGLRSWGAGSRVRVLGGCRLPGVSPGADLSTVAFCGGEVSFGDPGERGERGDPGERGRPGRPGAAGP